MPALVEVDGAAVARRLREVCATRPQVAAAYHFGSTLARCRPDSDIDVGVVRRGSAGEGPDQRFRAGMGLEGDLIAGLGSLGGHRFDVTVLDGGHPLFAMRVLRSGRLCHVGDDDAHTDFLERVAQGYRDLGPRHELALREVMQEWAVRGGR